MWFKCAFSNNNSEYLFYAYLSGEMSIPGLCLFFWLSCLSLRNDRYSLSALTLNPSLDAWFLNIFCRLNVVLVSDEGDWILPFDYFRQRKEQAPILRNKRQPASGKVAMRAV